MRRQRNAKIIATIGPASSEPQMLRKLAIAGVDVFRLNFSHGSHERHSATVAAIRELETELDRPIAILQDLQGPKLRLGDFVEGHAQLQNGQEFRLDLSEALGNSRRAPMPHPEIFAALVPGSDLLVDDGKVRLRVKACGPDYAETEVVVGGRVSNHKGVNVPGVVLPISPLTSKDRADLAFGLSLGVDWVALSFVQRPEDIQEARELIGDKAWIIAKLEKPAALDHLEAIVEAADAIMVARGDLGVELPPERVPRQQKRIVRACRAVGKPVVVATQMLESMTQSPTPTRAEASDVATAIYDDADAVMLSAETAAGQYPVEAVEIMDRIIVQVERDPMHRVSLDAQHPEAHPTAPDAVSSAVRAMTYVMPVAATVPYTSSGFTSLRMAHERPGAPILSLTPNRITARRLALVWGIHSVFTEDARDIEDMVAKACHNARAQGFAKAGEHIIIVAGMPFGQPGNTNLIRLAVVD